MSRSTRVILIGCFIILILVWIIPELGEWVRSMTGDTFYIVFSLMIAGVVLIAYALGWKERERKQQAIRQKIVELQLKQFALHREQSENLTNSDILSLRAYKVIVLSIVGSLGLIVIMVILIMSVRQSVKLIGIGSAVVTLLIILLEINKRMNLMFENARKIIVRGVVTKKNTALDDGHDSKPHHWLYIGDRKIKVEMEIYRMYDIGNAAEFHLFERFGTVILRHEKLEGSGIGGD